MPAKTPLMLSAGPNHQSHKCHDSREHPFSRVRRALGTLGYGRLSQGSEDHRLSWLSRVLPEQRVWRAAREANPKKTWEPTTGRPQRDMSDVGVGRRKKKWDQAIRWHLAGHKAQVQMVSLARIREPTTWKRRLRPAEARRLLPGICEEPPLHLDPRGLLFSFVFFSFFLFSFQLGFE